MHSASCTGRCLGVPCATPERALLAPVEAKSPKFGVHSIGKMETSGDREREIKDGRRQPAQPRALAPPVHGVRVRCASPPSRAAVCRGTASYACIRRAPPNSGIVGGINITVRPKKIRHGAIDGNSSTVSWGHQENRDESARRGFLAVFLTRGHPTAWFLNQLSARKGGFPPPRRHASCTAVRDGRFAEEHCSPQVGSLPAAPARQRGPGAAAICQRHGGHVRTSSGELSWLHMYGSFA